MWKAKIQPKTPANGSTSPLACPISIALVLDTPSLLKGSDVATPSGKFWIPIPKANIIDEINIDISGLLNKLANATPIAIPSGVINRN